MRILLFSLLLPVFLFSEINILVLGDSNSYGVPNRECSWVSILKKEYQDNSEIVFFNYAIGMATSDQIDMLHILGSEYHHPNIIIYAGGLVDVLLQKNLGNMKTAILQTLKRSLKQDQIVLFGIIDFLPWEIMPFQDLQYLESATNIFLEIANEASVIPFVFLDKELLTNSLYNLGDTVHPNFEGQKIIAKRIKGVLENILNSYRFKN